MKLIAGRMILSVFTLMSFTAQACTHHTSGQAKQNATSEIMEQTMLEEIPMDQIPDTDNDGVVDPPDPCVNTPQGQAVDERGCPI